MLEQLTTHLATRTLWQAAYYSLAINIFIFGQAMLLGKWVLSRPTSYLVAEKPPATTAFEWRMAGLTVLLNSFVNWLGWWLWQKDWIMVVHCYGWCVLTDLLFLFLTMDLAMYVLHRVAHHRLLYGWVHALHHRYENPQPISLFVLNPAETLGFGGLWLVLLCLRPVSWWAVIIYLTANLVFGLMGHLGIEPLPKKMAQHFFIKWFTTSTFHAHHHQDARVNFGFYTIVWDKLFNTLAKYYHSHFGQLPPHKISPFPDQNEV